MQKRIFLIIFMLIIVIPITGCKIKMPSINAGKHNTKTSTVKKEKVDLVGTYLLIGMKNKDEKYTKKDLESLKEYEMEVVLELKKDKTATLNVFDDKKKFKYDNKNFYVEGEKVPFTYEDNKLILEQDGQILTFEKEKELE